MSKLWLTYAWKDNEDADVDFVAQSVIKEGIDVGLDRSHLLAGRRLWDQIARQIEDPNLDAWAIFVTEASLASEPCQEELAYALDRVLRTKGSAFPLIGIFPAPIERSLIPSSLATRLYVSLRDADWASRVADAVRGQTTQSIPQTAEEHFKCHILPDGMHVYEVRPRSGIWYPPRFAVLETEVHNMRFKPYLGPSGMPQFVPAMFPYAEGSTVGPNGETWITFQITDQLDNSRSMYLRSVAPLSAIGFGGRDRLKVLQL